jgi:hypothetical protein
MQSTIRPFDIGVRLSAGRRPALAFGGLLLAMTLPLSLPRVRASIDQTFFGTRQRAPVRRADPFRNVPLDPSCIAWDAIAGEALHELAADRPAVANRQRTDASFRLQRARRNCAAGWLNIACADYQALIAGPLPLGFNKLRPLAVPQVCRGYHRINQPSAPALASRPAAR